MTGFYFLSMSSGKQKKYDATTAQNNQNIETAVQNVQTVSPYEQMMQDQWMKLQHWKTGTGEYAGKPKDIRDMPGLDTSIYEVSQALADQEMRGGGAMNLASPASGAHAANLKQQHKFNLYNARAAALNHDARNLDAQASGTGNALVGYDFNRKGAVLGARTNQQQLHLAQPRPKNPWSTVAQIAIGGLGAATGLGWKPFG